MVEVGFTDGFDTVELNPDAILVHEYVSPLTAVAPSDMVVPEQMAVLAVILAEGSGLTDIFTLLKLEQPVALTVSTNVYVVVVVGLTDGLEDVELNPDGELVQE